ncbi:arginine--tRNA ligase [uncultured Dialister sp.]|uniref:arginine--tRNA ligase n=1 Tax=uncultured Dialister sp. TaxID=278064 RepID=UPI00260A652B|nr:arginine--tRNA ligase [uncultured Dialister sp.]
MEVREELKELIEKAKDAAVAAGELPEGDYAPVQRLEVPKEKEFGDYSTNAAMQWARTAHKAPRMIAESIVKHMDTPLVTRMDIAGAGFINFFLARDTVYSELKNILKAGPSYGDLPKDKKDRVLVEYVSANPTGPLHIGHARGAAYGSALVNLLRAAGYDVLSEYYVNDAGNQIDHLAESINARYLQLNGIDAEIPDDGYHGQDIVETARHILERDGKKYLDMDEKERLEIFKEVGLKEKLAALKKDLHDFNVDFDNWFSEKSLYPDQVNAALKVLKDEDNMYEKDGALWLRTTKNGDDKDRVVIRTNGVPTYFCSDIAYVGNKIRRGYNKLIDIWGADHHGYIIRLKTAMKFLGYNPDDFEIMLLQMVTLLRDGKPVKMSKRTGEAVTLRELMDEVGTDAARYFFCARTLDSQMDFDIDLAKKHSNENPVYYIQYANARIHSLFAQAKEAGVSWDKSFKDTDFTKLTEECELDLIKKMENYHQLVAGAAQERAPQRIAKYAYELAALFHHFYRECRILGVDSETTKARLGLITAVQYILVHALHILGLSAPEHM